MSKEVTNPLAKFADDAMQHRRPQSRVEGGYLSFNGKTGEWTMGLEETDVAGEEVLIASQTMQHGYIRWGTKPPAKEFATVNQPYPEAPAPVEGTDYEGRPKTFHGEEARQFTGKFLDEDLGQFVFNTSSMGGVENIDKLFDAIILKSGDGTPFCYPVCRLENEWYKRSTGKIYKPVFEIAHWADINGNQENAKIAAQDAEEDDQEDADASPRRRRRR